MTLGRAVRAALRHGLAAAGIAFLLALAAACTPLPRRVYNWLGQAPESSAAPDYIVVLGGGGIPSDSGLIRAYYGAAAAARHPAARVVVALPYEGRLEDSATGRMVDEFVMRGVARDRMLIESRGRNTHEQAVRTAELVDALPGEARLLLVTDPEHMRRALLSFRKAGFAQVYGRSAFRKPVEADLTRDDRPDRKLGRLLPKVGHRMLWRYGFWNNLLYECLCARELAALAYYRCMGWI